MEKVKDNLIFALVVVAYLVGTIGSLIATLQIAFHYFSRTKDEPYFAAVYSILVMANVYIIIICPVSRYLVHIPLIRKGGFTAIYKQRRQSSVGFYGILREPTAEEMIATTGVNPFSFYKSIRQRKSQNVREQIVNMLSKIEKI